jgi:hypothetical protein
MRSCIPSAGRCVGTFESREGASRLETQPLANEWYEPPQLAPDRVHPPTAVDAIRLHSAPESVLSVPPTVPDRTASFD